MADVNKVFLGRKSTMDIDRFFPRQKAYLDLRVLAYKDIIRLEARTMYGENACVLHMTRQKAQQMVDILFHVYGSAILPTATTGLLVKQQEIIAQINELTYVK